MSNWLSLLQGAVEQRGSIQAVADLLGRSRTAVSLALAGKYPGRTERLEALVLAKLADRVACPHLRRDVARDECEAKATRPMPMSNPQELRHWSACQSCPNRPEGGDNVE